VQKAFYGVLLSKNVLEITQASFVNAKENLSNVKAMYEQGMVSEFDKLQAEVQVENIRPVVLQMENTLKSAKDGLKILLGVNQNEDIDVSGEFDHQSYDISNEEEIINEALTSNFDLKTLDLKKQVDVAFIQLDISQYWPTIAAFGNYTYAGSSDKWTFQNYSSMTVGLSFSINLWQGNRTKHAVEQSTISYKQTEQQFFQLKEFTIASVKNKLQELKRVQSIIEAQEQNVKVAERAYEIAKVRYREGAGSQLEIQNADQALKQARLNRIQSIHSYLITKYELEQLLGRTNQNYFSNFQKIE
jgi:outer membrane protein TolC